ncbi:MAG TPA: dephospho-CoA kinase [Burkholderiales bacterium]|jgi:dephospho-CoA kinase|nr:dephospho-CoA kinase [Burkholderiales bacterium]
MKPVVGLTGGIGSGKSAAAEEFGRLGATVVDTDAIAHELTQAGGAAMPEVRRLFGEGYIDVQGAMDRVKMRALAFRDPAARTKLEQLLHPLIRAESERRIAAAGGTYVVHVVPLLIESRDYRQRVSRVLVVDCPEDTQIARVRQRSRLSEDEIRRILRSQASREERLAAADDVIDNSGTLDALHKQVRELHAKYLELARSPA